MSKSTVIKYVILNLIMAGLTTALTLFPDWILSRLIGTVLLMFVFGKWFVILVPLLIFMNVMAYSTVRDNGKNGVIFSALGGFISGFIAAHTVNKEYVCKSSVNFILNIWVYIVCVYPLMTVILLLTGHYSKI